MSNVFGAFMSYCRQGGAKQALIEALDQVEKYSNDPDANMSEGEVEAFYDYTTRMFNWMRDMCFIDDDGNLDESELIKFCDSLREEVDDSDKD